ncbi:uncharacterized protein BCR38DRAFT_22484 [Pseudomassariella vexata]|uniref:Proteasome assembly chaperone 3 n=1 Tax=Pseudomassariella vexata TaxID=1141098 RepID=A0A1Y2EKQ9_9PEZI|nr:uncharacterized protein BCR38DRAFT_22484 [Pseudomassariella vexata]ORY71886.1 hypothetical protein BCR38DRAFT_22484 [Pseudomassariella vexata]
MDQDQEVSFPLPRALDTRIHMRIITKSAVIIVQLTTVSAEEKLSIVPMGSMVYAMPDKFAPNMPLSTQIYKEEPTVDFTTRLAKILVKMTQMPVYVSSSLSLANTGLGGTFEEEMAAMQVVVEIASQRLQHVIKPSNTPAAAAHTGTSNAYSVSLEEVKNKTVGTLKELTIRSTEAGKS